MCPKVKGNSSSFFFRFQMQIVSTQCLLYLTQIFVPEQSCTYINNMTPDSHCQTFVSRYKRIVSIKPFHGVPNHTPNPNIYTSIENDH